MPLRWPMSRRIEFDENGERASGAIAYFWLAGTTTPLEVYQDADLNVPHDQDADGALSGDSKANAIGRWPEVWIPFSASGYREKVVTAGGTQLWDTDDIPRLDPVEAAGDTVDETQLARTGQVCWEPLDATRTGWVRLNGRTIGSATSGGTERANADTEDLFLYLWNNLANGQAAVSGGRGASAAADWAANKTIALLDGRAGLLMGLDDMGNSAASLLGTAPVVNGDAVTQGSILGANTHALTTAQLSSHTHSFSATSGTESQSHTHSGTTATESQSHTHSGTTGAGSAHSHGVVGFTTHTGGSTTGLMADTDVQNSVEISGSGGNGVQNESAHTHAFTSGNASQTHTHTVTTGNASQTHTHSVSGTSGSTGSGTAHNIVSKSILGTYFQKL